MAFNHSGASKPERTFSMNQRILRLFNYALSLVASLLLFTAGAAAQCSDLTTGLREPLGSALTNQGNLLISESGTGAPHSARISILDSTGNRRTLLDGL